MSLTVLDFSDVYFVILQKGSVPPVRQGKFIVMTGGGSHLRGFHLLLTKETGVPCYVADNPIACVALGAGKALENYELIKRSLPAY